MKTKQINLISLLTITVTVLSILVIGCDLANAILGFIPPDSVLNMQQLQQVDIAGQRNWFIPPYPDYSKDPTCVIPGFCGPNHWYPFSLGQQVEGGATATEAQ